MNIQSLLGENNITVSVSLNDLKQFALDIIEQTKREIEDLVVAQKSEAYVSRQRACEILDVNPVTLYRWNKRNYLVPCTVGGKKRYKMSEINNMLNIKK